MIGRFRKKLKSAVYGMVPRSRLLQRGPTGRARVALTFDDGPNELTAGFLERLDELGVRATFFLVGNKCEAQPDLMREYTRRGHQVASHGYDHTRFTQLSWGALVDQLDKTDRVLGRQPTSRPWVRPPHGAVDARVLGQLLAYDRLIALWSYDPRDYEVHDKDEIARRCRPERVSHGEVILLHEGRQSTLDALPAIVGGLRDGGYEMVTMAEMFASP
ncbi:MAG: polysaccharide deacetylase family protein [Labilithrix sp.]|nr:polysaccharide deacetylase family protein [Labilithrix sp.]